MQTKTLLKMAAHLLMMYKIHNPAPSVCLQSQRYWIFLSVHFTREIPLLLMKSTLPLRNGRSFLANALIEIPASYSMIFDSVGFFYH